jgi:hypothetical protein
VENYDKSTLIHRGIIMTVPSAGACHAFETYILVNRVEGLEPGIYRFLALKHDNLLSMLLH